MKKLVFAFLCISLILASACKKGEKKKGSGAARGKVRVCVRGRSTGPRPATKAECHSLDGTWCNSRCVRGWELVPKDCDDTYWDWTND